jgi:undecaprenyl-diphosphatase
MFAIDQTISLFFLNIQTPFLTTAFYTVTWFFNPLPVVCLLLIISYGLYDWGIKKDKRKTLVEFWGAILLSTFFVWIVKYLVHASRPETALLSVFGPSFPSAHTAIATTICFFFLRYMRHEKNTLRRYVHILFCILVPVVVGMSRIYLQVHWFSDVVVGASIGLFALYISDYLWNRYHTSSRE